jgi:hypothetical protein
MVETHRDYVDKTQQILFLVAPTKEFKTAAKSAMHGEISFSVKPGQHFKNYTSNPKPERS